MMEKTLEIMDAAAVKHLAKIADDIEHNGGDFVGPNQVHDALNLLKIRCKIRDIKKAM